MFQHPPSWAFAPPSQRHLLNFRWDDTRASKDFLAVADPFLDSTESLSVRARLVLCVGMYEWIVWRFDGMHARHEVKKICEAAWLATIDPRYINFFELTRIDWRGPVLGPLWCATTWLRPALAEGDFNPSEVEDALQYLFRLGVHVAPHPEAFEGWLLTVAARMAPLYPRQADDPFEDLFDRGIGPRRGRLIDRDVLDTARPVSDESASAFTAALFRQASPETNPFLAHPDDLMHAGMASTPYQLRP